jgi:hypothetical protein
MALAALLLSLLPSALWAGWRFTTPMPHGRQDFGAVYDGRGRIYVMGGNVFEVKPHKHTRCYREGIYSTLVYDMKKDRWEYLDPVPGTVWDDIFLYFDKDRGVWRYGKKKLVFRRPGEGESWEYVLPEEFASIAEQTRNTDLTRYGGGVRIAMLKDGWILWTGGRRHVGSSENAVLGFDTGRDRWCKVTGRMVEREGGGYILKAEYDPPIPWMKEQRTLHEAVTCPDGRVYVMGGWRLVEGAPEPGGDPMGRDVEYVNDSVECYDPAKNTWTCRRPMPSPRMFFAAVAMPDGRIYVFGGQTADERHYRNLKVLDVVEVYDPAGDTWTRAGVMPGTREGHAAVLGGDGRVYITGGSQTIRSPIEKVTWIYDPGTGAWKKGPKMNRARFGHRMVAVPGRIYSIGGTDYEGDGFRSLANERMLPKWLQVYQGKVQETVEVLDIPPK